MVYPKVLFRPNFSIKEQEHDSLSSMTGHGNRKTVTVTPIEPVRIQHQRSVRSPAKLLTNAWGDCENQHFLQVVGLGIGSGNRERWSEHAPNLQR